MHCGHGVTESDRVNHYGRWMEHFNQQFKKHHTLLAMTTNGVSNSLFCSSNLFVQALCAHISVILSLVMMGNGSHVRQQTIVDNTIFQPHNFCIADVGWGVSSNVIYAKIVFKHCAFSIVIGGSASGNLLLAHAPLQF